MSTMHCSLLSLGCVFGFSPASNTSKLTALRAFKIAQRRLRPEVRAKLLSGASARTDASLVPEAWRFVFLDPATSGHCRVVTVAAKNSSEHPDTVEAFSSSKTEDVLTLHPITQAKLLIDSDQALALARKHSKHQAIRAAEFHLTQPGGHHDPVWIVALFEEGAETPARFQVGAKTGEIQAL